MIWLQSGRDESNTALLLATRAGKMYGLLTECEVKMYRLLTKCEVKSARYWPSFSFSRCYGPRRRRGPLTRKKRTRPISSHLDRTSLVNKGFIIWLSGKFLLWDTAGSPRRAGKMAGYWPRLSWVNIPFIIITLDPTGISSISSLVKILMTLFPAVRKKLHGGLKI